MNLILDNALPQLTEAVSILIEQAVQRATRNMVPAEQVDQRIAEATENMITMDDWPGGGCWKWVSIEEANDRPWRTESQNHAPRRIGAGYYGQVDHRGQIEAYGDWRWGTVEDRNRQTLGMLNRYINAQRWYELARSGPWISIQPITGQSEVERNICRVCSEEDYERAVAERRSAFEALSDFLTEDFSES